MCIYNVSVTICFVLPILSSGVGGRSSSYLIRAFAILFVCVSTVGILYIPKLRAIRWGKDGGGGGGAAGGRGGGGGAMLTMETNSKGDQAATTPAQAYAYAQPNTPHKGAPMASAEAASPAAARASPAGSSFAQAHRSIPVGGTIQKGLNSRWSAAASADAKTTPCSIPGPLADNSERERAPEVELLLPALPTNQEPSPTAEDATAAAVGGADEIHNMPGTVREAN